MIVRLGRHVWIFDAKYKRHFEELDMHQWLELREEMRAEHRHDLHQVLAYAATADADQITAVLVYPMQLPAWEHLADHRATVNLATIAQTDREVNLALVGVPMQLPRGDSTPLITGTWSELLPARGAA